MSEAGFGICRRQSPLFAALTVCAIALGCAYSGPGGSGEPAMEADGLRMHGRRVDLLDYEKDKNGKAVAVLSAVDFDGMNAAKQAEAAAVGYAPGDKVRTRFVLATSEMSIIPKAEAPALPQKEQGPVELDLSAWSEKGVMVVSVAGQALGGGATVTVASGTSTAEVTCEVCNFSDGRGTLRFELRGNRKYRAGFEDNGKGINLTLIDDAHSLFVPVEAFD